MKYRTFQMNFYLFGNPYFCECTIQQKSPNFLFQIRSKGNKDIRAEITQ